MKKFLLVLVFIMIVPIKVKADTLFGIDATWANYEEKNDSVWVVVYKVPYGQILPSDYNGIIKYDSNAFTFNHGKEDLSQYAGDLVLPCEGCKGSNSEELGEVILTVNKEINEPVTANTAPGNILLPFKKKENFDASKEYEFSYDSDISNEIKIIVKFDENGKAEVVSATGPRFDFTNAKMKDVDNENDTSELKNNDIKDEETTETSNSNKTKKYRSNINEYEHNKSMQANKKEKTKVDNTSLYIYIAYGAISIVLALVVVIVVTRKKKVVK